jgi:hypothetical protein
MKNIADLVREGQVWCVDKPAEFGYQVKYNVGDSFCIKSLIEFYEEEEVIIRTDDDSTVVITLNDIEEGFITLVLESSLTGGCNTNEIKPPLQEAYNNLINKFKEDVLEIVDAHVSKLHTDFAPHLQQDTDYNVSSIASTLVNKLVRGDFERHNESSVVVKDDNGIGTYIRLTSHQYDSLRKNLIEVMPECPKDLEIESLKEQLQHAYERNY